MICPKTTRTSLVKQCKRLGVKLGDVVMVHASMRTVGPILGGPDMLIEAILESIGAQGAMMMYLSCEPPFNYVGRPKKFSAREEEFILANCPAFDPMRSRARRSHGILAEFFRTTEGVICSHNPGCRMAAIGERAGWLMEDHPMNYGLGKGSPLEKLCQINGKILLIGTLFDTTTLLHYAEAVSPISNKAIVHIKTPLLIDGVKQWVDIEEFDSSNGIRDWTDEEFFGTIVEEYLEEHNIHPKNIGNAPSYLIPARELVEFAVPIMVEEAMELDQAQSAGDPFPLMPEFKS